MRKATTIKPFVKKTASGKFVFALEYNDREKLFMALVNFLETESVNIRIGGLKDREDFVRHLYCATLDELLQKHMGKLCSANKIEKLQLKRSEALAITWLLRTHNDQVMLDLKGSLHQKLL